MSEIADIDNIEEFIQIDKRIDAAEEQEVDSRREHLRDRWEFGKLMLAKRRGKRLPNGYLEKLAETIGKSQSELKYRAQFAETYSTEEQLAMALASCKSWTQVKRSLPKPPEPGANPRPAAPPQPAPQPAPPPPSPAEREFERRVQAEVRTRADQYRAQCDENVAAYKAKLEDDAKRRNAIRDEERERYKLGIEVQRAKGLITPEEYDVIRSCLHPDSRLSASDQKLATAFRLFNDPKVKILLVKEPPKPKTPRVGVKRKKFWPAAPSPASSPKIPQGDVPRGEVWVRYAAPPPLEPPLRCQPSPACSWTASNTASPCSQGSSAQTQG